MNKIWIIAGVAALIAQPFAVWTVVPALVSGLIFAIAFIVEKLFERERLQIKLEIAEDALKQVGKNDDAIAALTKTVNKHTSDLTALNLKLNMR